MDLAKDPAQRGALELVLHTAAESLRFFAALLVPVLPNATQAIWQQLGESGELLRQAKDLRALIIRVREAAIAGSVGVDEATLKSWEAWASAEADRLDPIQSGQIMTHLAPAGQ